MDLFPVCPRPTKLHKTQHRTLKKKHLRSTRSRGLWWFKTAHSLWAHTGTVPLMSNPVAHTSRLSLWWVININWCCFTWSHRPLISNCLYPINMAGSLYLCKDNNFLIHELQSITHCSVLIPLLPGVWWEHWCWESSIQAPKHWLLRGRRQRLWLPTPLWPTPHLTSDQSPWDKKKNNNKKTKTNKDRNL